MPCDLIRRDLKKIKIKIIWGVHILVGKQFLEFKTIRVSTNSVDQKYLGVYNCCGQIFLVGKKMLGATILNTQKFWGKKVLGVKHFGGAKILEG